MVLNYTKLIDALMPIRYPFPNKEALLHKIQNCNVRSKFDLKSGFWWSDITFKHKYKTRNLVPHDQYHW